MTEFKPHDEMTNAERVESLLTQIKSVAKNVARKNQYMSDTTSMSEEDIFQDLCMFVLSRQSLSIHHRNSYRLLTAEAGQSKIRDRDSQGISAKDESSEFVHESLARWTSRELIRVLNTGNLPELILNALDNPRMPKQYRQIILDDAEKVSQGIGIGPQSGADRAFRLRARDRLRTILNLPDFANQRCVSEELNREVPDHLKLPHERSNAPLAE